MEDNNIKQRRTFRLSDEDMKKLDEIASRILGDSKRNLSLTLRMIINNEYKKEDK